MKNSNQTQKGFIVPLLAALVVVLVAGGVYWAWHGKNNGTVVTDNSVTQLADAQKGVYYNIKIYYATSSSAVTVTRGALPTGFLIKYMKMTLPCFSQATGCPSDDGFRLVGQTQTVGEYCFDVKFSNSPVQKYALSVKNQLDQSNSTSADKAPSVLPGTGQGWKTYTNANFNIQYPSGWNAGQDMVIRQNSYLFCPPEFSDPDPGVVCKIKNNAPHMSGTYAPIALFTYEKIAPPVPSDHVHVWQGHEVAFALELLNESYRDVYTQMIGTFHSSLVQISTSTNSQATEPIPVITSISPSSGPIGTTIELKGTNLTGFEGDLDAWIEDSAGSVGFLPGIGSVPRTDQTVRVTIPNQVCRTNNNYSGLPCSSFMTITPGTYSIFVEPWSVESNKVKLTVVASNPVITVQPQITLLSPNGGERLVKGTTYRITWNTSQSFSANYSQVRITLVAGNQSQAVVPDQSITTNNSGSYDWSVPTSTLGAYIQDYSGGPYTLKNVNNQAQFKFQIEGYPAKSMMAEGPSDYSDNYFTITN